MINISFNIRVIFLTSLAMILFLSNTTGFDLYAHSLMYYFFNEIITHSYLLFDAVVLPRYLLLSSIYELTSMFGIPIGIVAFLLIVWPTYSIFTVLNKENSTRKYSFFSLMIIGIVFLQCLYYSGLALVILYFIAYYLTKKSYFLVGGVFHPIGVIMYLGALIFYSRSGLIYFLIILCNVLIFYYFSTRFDWLNSNSYDNIKFIVNIDTIFDLLKISFDKKMIEFFVMILISVFIIFFKWKLKSTKLTKKLRSISINKTYIDTGILLLTLFLALILFLKPSPNILRSVISGDINEVMYATWFDWGEKDLKSDYIYLFQVRFVNVGGPG